MASFPNDDAAQAAADRELAQWQARRLTPVTVPVFSYPEEPDPSSLAPFVPLSPQTTTQTGPFDFMGIVSGELTLFPGTVNQLLVDDPLGTISISGSGTTHITLVCETDGSQVVSASYTPASSPPAPPVAVKGGLPSSFTVYLGFIIGSTSGSTVSYKKFKTWPHGCNIAAVPQHWIDTDRDDPEPGQTLTEPWYTWNIIAAINSPL